MSNLSFPVEDSFAVPSAIVGKLLIGTKGSIIKRLIRETRCHIAVMTKGDPAASSKVFAVRPDEQVVTVRGQTTQSVAAARSRIVNTMTTQPSPASKSSAFGGGSGFSATTGSGFGAPAAGGAFGAQPAGGGGFGAPAASGAFGTPAAARAFGATPAFTFGAAPAPAPTFNAAPAPSPAPTFGTTPAPAPTFGTTPAPAPTFNAAPAPVPALAFGTTPAPAPTFGTTPAFTFGAVPAPAPTFNAAPAPSPAPTFGTTPAPAPTFGTTPAFTFGTAPAPAPTFGTTPAFTFGTTPAPAPSFGTTPAFTFGAAPAPTFNAAPASSLAPIFNAAPAPSPVPTFSNTVGVALGNTNGASVPKATPPQQAPFGQQWNTCASSFGAQPSTGGFGSQQPATGGGLFGSSSTYAGSGGSFTFGVGGSHKFASGSPTPAPATGEKHFGLIEAKPANSPTPQSFGFSAAGFGAGTSSTSFGGFTFDGGASGAALFGATRRAQGVVAAAAAAPAAAVAAPPAAGVLETEMKSSMKWLQAQEKKVLQKVDESMRSVVGQDGADGNRGQMKGGDFAGGGGSHVSLAALRGSLNARGGNIFSPGRGELLRPISVRATPKGRGDVSSREGFSSPTGIGKTAYTRALGQRQSTAQTEALASAVPLGSSARKMLTIKPRVPRPPNDTLQSISPASVAEPISPSSEIEALPPPPVPEAGAAGGGMLKMSSKGHRESAGGAPALPQISPLKVFPGTPVLTKAHYVCSPPLSELKTLSASEIRSVHGFVVEKYDPKTSERVGSIAWLDPVNLENANLNEDVSIVNCHSEPKGHFSVAVYEHCDKEWAPKAGDGLNQRAEVTFWGVHCKSSNPDKIAAYPEKLRDMVSNIGGTFVSYKDGVLKYRVSDFDAE